MSRTRLTADLVLAAATELLQKLSGFVVLAIVTRRFAPDVVGDFLLALTLGAVAAAITEAGTGRYLVREVAQRPAEARARLGEVLALRIALAVACLVLLAGAAAVLRPALVRVVIPTGAALLLAEVYFAYGAFLLGQRRVALRFVTGAVGPALGLSLAAVAAGAGAALSTVLAAWAAGVAAGAAAAAIVVRSRFGPVPLRPAGAEVRRAARAALPFFALSLLGLAHFKADTLLLFALAGPVAVAWYESGYKLLEASRVALRPAMMVFYPMSAALAASDPRELRRLVRRLLATALVLGVASSAVLVALARPILSLVWGATYAGAEPVAKILFLAVPAVYVELSAVFLAGAVRREGAAARLLAGALTVNVLLNLLAIPRWGPEGAAWVTVGTETATAAALVLLLRAGRTRRAESVR
jgi:O-antigen/teichoic acid export membrane protein